MAKEQPWKNRTPLTDKYIIQQFFIGSWDDCTTAKNISEGREKVKEARLHNHRKTRLIQRVETLIDELVTVEGEGNDGY